MNSDMKFNDIGYSPDNLKALLKQALPELARPREHLADELGVSAGTIDRWCVGLESKRHYDMSLKMWNKALEILTKEYEENVMDTVSQEPECDCDNVKITMTLSKAMCDLAQDMAKERGVTEATVVAMGLLLLSQ
jgi:cyclopropane fatty-acyl-phospholipid synthase-like methyltransferase